MNFNDVPSGVIVLFVVLAGIAISPWFSLWRLGDIATELKKIREELENFRKEGGR